MKTFNNIINALKQIVTEHKLLGSENYFFGEPFDFRTVNKSMPQIIIQPIPFSINKEVITYKLRLSYIDILDSDLTNLQDVYSDSIQTLNDILNKLEYDENFLDEYFLNYNITFNNFQFKYDELTAGHWIDIEIETSRIDNTCVSPFFLK